MSTNDTREEHAPSSVASKPELSQEDRSARIAVTVFPLIIIAAFALGLIFPTQAAKLASGVNIGLGIIMFGMGLTLTLPDFALVVKRPLPVIVGVIAQYVIMPGVAFLLTKVLNLDPAIAAGVILVGCAPGGTASNVISYLAKGDVALSVTMTSISTLLAPLMTPLLTKWLAGQYMPVDAKSMAISIVQIVLVPVIAGIVVRMLAGRYVEKILPALPWISVLGISYVLAAVVGKSADKIMESALIVFVVVILHNLLGYFFGYFAGRISGGDYRAARTTAIEVGMQNSGLAAGLATKYFSPEAALPGAVFSVWHNLSGALLAMFFRRFGKQGCTNAEGKISASITVLLSRRSSTGLKLVGRRSEYRMRRPICMSGVL